jgi:hypothetical protein
MLRFRHELEKFLPLIQRTAYLISAELLPGPDGSFINSFLFLGKWDHPVVGEYCRVFTREQVFGSFLHAVSPKPYLRPCQEKSEIIRAILHRRIDLPQGPVKE